jgi:hypothetical protein
MVFLSRTSRPVPGQRNGARIFFSQPDDPLVGAPMDRAWLEDLAYMRGDEGPTTTFFDSTIKERCMHACMCCTLSLSVERFRGVLRQHPFRLGQFLALSLTMHAQDFSHYRDFGSTPYRAARLNLTSMLPMRQVGAALAVGRAEKLQDTTQDARSCQQSDSRGASARMTKVPFFLVVN